MANIAITENDINLNEAEILLSGSDELNSFTKALSAFNNRVGSYNSVKFCVIAILYALLANRQSIIKLAKDILLLAPGQVPPLLQLQELKDIIANTRANKAVMAKFTEIQTQLFPKTSATQQQTTAQQAQVINNDFNKGGPEIIFDTHGASNGFFRIIAYNKAYSPMARQYLVFRHKIPGTDTYSIGIDGTPRHSSVYDEPVFSTVQQATDFCKNATRINTVKDLSKFRFVITDRALQNINTLSGYNLVNTSLGTAYLNTNSRYSI